MSTKLGDNLMRVLKLDATSSNWVIYKNQFQWAIDARGLLEHVDGSAWEPTKPTLLERRWLQGKRWPWQAVLKVLAVETLRWWES